MTGPGPIGRLCVQVLVHSGVKVIVAGLRSDQKRLQLARKLGACQTVDLENEDLGAVVNDLTNGAGVDSAYEISGSEAAVASCLESLRPLGSYTQVGHFGKPVTVPYDLICFKQLKVFGSVGYNRGTWKKTLRLLDHGLRPSAIVSHTFPLSDWETGFTLFEKQEATKVILVPS